ncbi:MAG: hypothetical protein ACNA7W_12350 [Pseudomonadales bacterium]
MKLIRILSGLLTLIGILGCSPADSETVSKAAADAPAAEQHDYISGRVVAGADVPQGGVWVIAETDALATPYRKIVVTDEQGRFVVPELPGAAYRVWVRGYGLRDSARVTAEPGAALELRAEPAADPQQAAAIYPASYWLSLLEPPDHSASWASHFKLGCQLCHQVGALLTRNLDRAALDLGLMKTTYMDATADGLGRERLLDAMGDWQRRIRDGETPPSPPRPNGVERNLVITQWAWGDAFTYAHDEIATDKRDPTLYANGPIYGVDLANDRMLVLDPQSHIASTSAVPTLDGHATPWCEQTYQPLGSTSVIPIGLGSLGCPSRPGITAFEGKYQNPANPHNPMFDDQGRVWITTQIRREWAEDLPDFCKASPVIADNYHHRQLGWFDPKTDTYQLIDTCYGTHHLQFDANGVLWTSGDSHVIGWFDPGRYDPARPETLVDAQGWSEVIIDSDGDGTADTPLEGFNYGIIPNPTDGSVWTAQPGGHAGGPIDYRGRLIRYDPATDRHEVYVPPAPGAGPRGVDVDGNGIIWASLGGSGHLARFDRSRCQQTWGEGQQCPEGWTLYRSPGPLMRTRAEDPAGRVSADPAGRVSADPAGGVSADFHYYLFVDQFNTLGLGNDVVIMNGTGSDALLAFDQQTESFTVIRIPYPLNTFTRGLDGRIDDATRGWKGRGLWFTNGLDPIFHSEIPRSYVGKVQLRPHPLAH